MCEEDLFFGKESTSFNCILKIVSLLFSCHWFYHVSMCSGRHQVSVWLDLQLKTGS